LGFVAPAVTPVPAINSSRIGPRYVDASARSNAYTRFDRPVSALLVRRPSGGVNALRSSRFDPSKRVNALCPSRVSLVSERTRKRALSVPCWRYLRVGPSERVNALCPSRVSLVSERTRKRALSVPCWRYLRVGPSERVNALCELTRQCALPVPFSPSIVDLSDFVPVKRSCMTQKRE